MVAPGTVPATIEPPLILAIDVGTSSLRVLVYDRLGRELDELGARVSYQPVAGDDGRSELDPVQLRDHLFTALDRVHALVAARGLPLAAVALDTFAYAGFAADAQGRLLTPLFLWSDTRPWRAAIELRHQVDERAVHARTGCPIHASYLPARLRWLRTSAPDVAREMRAWLTFGEYLEQVLFGAARVTFSIASWSGLLDRWSLRWDQNWLELLNVDERLLSPLVDRDEPLAGLAGELRSRWPLLAEIPWFPAIGDGAAANVGSGCIGPGRAALTVGTSGALRVVLDAAAPEVPWGLWEYRVDRARTLLGGALSEGGNVYAWLQDTLRLGPPAEVEAAIAALPPDGHGLTVLPFLAGERSPGWAGQARAALVGLALGTSPLEIVRAALEAVAYRVALLDRLLSQAIGPERLVVASGGALTSSPTWLQIMADVLGRSLVVSTEEATARGAALLAAHALGAVPSLVETAPAGGPVCEPDLARHARYQQAIERQAWLYAALVRRDVDALKGNAGGG